MRILIVDDDKLARVILRKALEQQGHQVVDADCAPQALELADRGNIDMIMSDWVMPDMDGLQFCQAIRQRDMSNYIYFVMITAKTEQEAKILALNSGVDDILTKPIDLAELEARLVVAERIIAMQEQLRQKSGELSNLTTVLEMANRRVSELFRGLPIACVTISSDGLVMEFNKAAEGLFQVQGHEVWMQPLWEVIVNRKHKKYAKELAWTAIAGEGGFEQMDWSYPLKDGRNLHLLISTFPLKSSQGDVVGAAIAMVDITAQKLMEEQVTEQLMFANELSMSLEIKNRELEELSRRMELLASTDGLTGLYNFRIFKQQLNECMEKARANGTPLSIILTDVDKFKSFNDEFGHLVGDEVLRKVASVMREKADKTETVFLARYGGEEFVMIAPGYGEAEVLAFAEEVRAAVEAEHWPWRQVTSSFGTATFVPSLELDTDFIERADNALYAAKEGGRNRVETFENLNQAKAA